MAYSKNMANNQQDCMESQSPRTSIEERRKNRDSRKFTGESHNDYEKLDRMDAASLAMTDGVEEYEQIRQGEERESANNNNN